jgi:hypothetical protein
MGQAGAAEEDRPGDEVVAQAVLSGRLVGDQLVGQRCALRIVELRLRRHLAQHPGARDQQHRRWRQPVAPARAQRGRLPLHVRCG